MKRKLAAVVMTLVLLLGLPFQAFAQETTQPTQAAQTTETQPEETQPEETRAVEIKETISIYTPEDLAALGENCALDTWSLDKQVVLEADISLSEVDFASLKSQAIQMASNAMAVPVDVSEESKETEVSKEAEEMEVSKESKEESNDDSVDDNDSTEDSTNTENSHLLSLAVHIAGVSILIEEVSSANEHMAIVKTAIAGLQVSVEQRAFDTDVVVSLNRIEVKDCLQSLSKREERFLVVSKTVNEKGEIDRDTEQDLFKVTVTVVKPSSPDYASASSDVSVHVCFGSLSGGRE